MRTSRFALLLGLLLGSGLLILPAARAAVPQAPYHAWASTPPMGWNSWDCFGCSVTEAQTKANADYMAEKLKAHGWEYIVVDIQWYTDSTQGYHYAKKPEITMDEWGRLLPVASKFPSAAEGRGFKPLADYVHSKGLKFGLHLLRGIPRKAVELNTPILGSKVRAADIADKKNVCPWNPDMYGVDMTKPGAQEYYDSVFKLFAEWGLDYVKVDDLSARIYQKPEVEGLRNAIDHCGRPIVFSTSPGETPLAEGAHVATHANLWRVSNDFWDDWPALYAQFKRLHDWTPFRGPGYWPDADMLPLGNVRAAQKKGWTRFTRDEQVTMMTLWLIARSPLMFGGNLPKNDDFTLSLITNDEALAVGQKSANNRQLFRTATTVAWVADVPGSKAKYLAVFNVGPGPKKKPAFGEDATSEGIDLDYHGPLGKVPARLADLGFTGECAVRDVWKRQDLGTFKSEFAPELPLHGAGLYCIEQK